MNIEAIASNYNILAALVFLAGVIILIKATNYLAFKHPDLLRMREWNREEDRPKKANPKWRPVALGNRKAGAIFNGGFALLICPFVVSLGNFDVWKMLLDIFLVLMIYDFFYYLTHRFIFHGKILKRVHGLHHQARNPSFSDAHYVHPTETAVGLGLFIGTVSVYGFVAGYHALTLAIIFLVFTQLNQINHCKFNLDSFPFRTINYLTTKHHIHHENMGMGNFATITPLFDWMFGTLD